MTWDLTAEFIAGVIVCIILVYSRKSKLLPNLKNRMYQVCLYVTLTSIATNLASTALLAYEAAPFGITYIITAIYFIVTPSMGLFYFLYNLAVIYEKAERIHKWWVLTLVPYVLYFFVTVSNYWTGAIFAFGPGQEYERGELVGLTYLIFYLYCLGSVLLVTIKRWQIEPSIRRILLCFPLIAFAVIIYQQVFPACILSGSAAACSLLIIYLYLQNKRIFVDTLTGVSNRQIFLRMLEMNLNKKQPLPLSVVLLSLTDFKIINDRFGQKSGDLILCRLADYLRTLVKDTWIYRYSGDQFVLLLTGSLAGKTAWLVQKLKERMEQPWNMGAFESIVPASIGVVEYPAVADSASDIIFGVESAVLKAKQSNGETVCYCTLEMLEALNRRNRIVEIMQEALEKDTFDVYFQPIWSLEENRFVLAEALLRLNQTPIGPVYPNEFVPIAEETGLIIDITYRVLEKACLFIRRLMDDGVDFSGVSVNFSFFQFLQEDVEEKVKEIIERNGIPATKLKIEITERVLITNPEMVTRFMKQMSGEGVRFGLDDFGTDYSNLSTLLTLPLDNIKIDKSIVWMATGNEANAAFFQSLIRSFKSLSYKIIAEGVETEQQREFAASCGCDAIQGFLYARPVTADEARLIFLGSPAKSG